MTSRREPILVLALIALHFAIYQTFCAIKFQYYLYRDFDLAIFVQAIHGVLHGEDELTPAGNHLLVELDDDVSLSDPCS